MNIDILAISELKCTGMGEFNSDDHYIYYCGQESLRRNTVAFIVNKSNQVIQVYAATTNAKEGEVNQFDKDLQHSRQSILKEFNPQYSLQGLMLKLQNSGHLMRRTDLLEKTLMLGKIEGRRKRGQQRMRLLDGISDSVDMSLSKLWEIVKDRVPGVVQSMGLQRVGHELVTEQQHLLELTPQRCPFHNRGLECKSRKSRDTGNKKQIWRGVQNEAEQRLTDLLRKHAGYSKLPFPKNQEMILQMNITR